MKNPKIVKCKNFRLPYGVQRVVFCEAGGWSLYLNKQKLMPVYIEKERKERPYLFSFNYVQWWYIY